MAREQAQSMWKMIGAKSDKIAEGESLYERVSDWVSESVLPEIVLGISIQAHQMIAVFLNLLVLVCSNTYVVEASDVLWACLISLSVYVTYKYLTN